MDVMASVLFQDEPVAVLIWDWAAAEYAEMLRKQFPQLRVLCASDAAALESHLAEADVLLASSFPAELFDRARRLKWFHCTNVGVDSILTLRGRLDGLVVTNARG